jgi:hypothetical protein
MTEAQYNRCTPYTDIVRIFATQGEYIGGADGLFDIIEQEFNSGKIDRSCNECRAGFLKFIYSEMQRYEKEAQLLQESAPNN